MTRKHPAAVLLGSIKTKKKSVASKSNGKRGGRPIVHIERHVSSSTHKSLKV